MRHYSVTDLTLFATNALCAVGLERTRAQVVAHILVEGDLLGHDTHGLALLPLYCAELGSGSMARDGDHEVLRDSGAAILWDGRRLPGPWLVEQGLALAQQRAAVHGSCLLAIRRSHHIAALAAYLAPVARNGFLVTLSSSDPTVRTVAPQGGREALYTPNPIASAWPAGDGIVMFDASMSVTANGVIARHNRAGTALPEGWLLDASGAPTTDAATPLGPGGGSVLPLGGAVAGHKGFALGLWVEAMTSGLAGHGRATPQADSLAASVSIQVIDPAFFSGAGDFAMETGHLADSCRQSAPRDPARPVRVPGDGALARRAKAMETGLALHPEVEAALIRLAAEGGCELTDLLAQDRREARA